jgi:hypothetical protein
MASKPLGQLVKDWRKAKAAMDGVVKNLPRIIGNESVAVVRDNFKQEAYDTGNGRTKWPKRKEATNKAYDRRKNGTKGSVFSSGNKVLDQTSAMREEVKYEVSGDTVRTGLDLNIIPYGRIHNEGLQGKAWGKHTFKMPKRQYMPTDSEGPNKKILDRIRKKIKYEFDKAMAIFKK